VLAVCIKGFYLKILRGTIPLGKRRRVECRIILKLMLTKLDGEGHRLG